MNKLKLNHYKETILDLLYFFDYKLEKENEKKIKESINVHILENILNEMLNVSFKEFTNEDLNSFISKM